MSKFENWTNKKLILISYIEGKLLLLISLLSKVLFPVIKGVWQKIIRIIQWHYNPSIRLKLTLSTLPLGLWSSGLHQSNSTSVCHGHGHSNNVTRWPATGRESFSLSILHHCKDIGSFSFYVIVVVTVFEVLNRRKNCKLMKKTKCICRNGI